MVEWSGSESGWSESGSRESGCSGMKRKKKQQRAQKDSFCISENKVIRMGRDKKKCSAKRVNCHSAN